MAKLTLPDIAKAMRKIDICMMTTIQANGNLESRPMSNNKDVDYDGNSHFFALDSASVVEDLKRNGDTSLSFVGHHSLVPHSIYIAITGTVQLTQDKATMKAHWVKDLEIWFEDGLDTLGLTLIAVKAAKLKYWDGQDEGEVSF